MYQNLIQSLLPYMHGARIMYMELTNTVSNPYMLSSDANSGQVIMQMCHYTYNHRSIPIRTWGVLQIHNDILSFASDSGTRGCIVNFCKVQLQRRRLVVLDRKDMMQTLVRAHITCITTITEVFLYVRGGATDP